MSNIVKSRQTTILQFSSPVKVNSSQFSPNQSVNGQIYSKKFGQQVKKCSLFCSIKLCQNSPKILPTNWSKSKVNPTETIASDLQSTMVKVPRKFWSSLSTIQPPRTNPKTKSNHPQSTLVKDAKTEESTRVNSDPAISD